MPAALEIVSLRVQRRPAVRKSFVSLLLLLCCGCLPLPAAHISAPASADQLIAAAGGIVLSQDVRFLCGTTSNIEAAYRGHATLLVLRGGGLNAPPTHLWWLEGAVSHVLSPRRDDDTSGSDERPADDAEAGERAVPLAASKGKRGAGQEPKCSRLEYLRFRV